MQVFGIHSTRVGESGSWGMRIQDGSIKGCLEILGWNIRIDCEH